MATLSNESVCGASFNKFSLLQELSGTDADQSLEVLESIDRVVSEDEAADAEPNENLTRAETSKSDLHLALPDNKEISSLKIEELKAELDKRGLKKSGNKSSNDLENLCVEIQKPCSKPFLVVTWYRPPCASAELFSHYETLVGKLDSRS